MKMMIRVPPPLTWHISHIVLIAQVALLYIFVFWTSLRVMAC
jgi:hypothetical protein